ELGERAMPLLLGIAFCLFTEAAGFAVVRLARIPAGWAAVALAAPVGLGTLAVMATWSSFAGFPPGVTTALVIVPVIGGLLFGMGTLVQLRSGLNRASDARPGLVLLVVALVL